MNIYLIDYENVSSFAIDALETVNKNDRIVIFYSKKCDKISFQMLHKIIHAKASLEIYEVQDQRKNSLDFQLVTYMGYLVAVFPQANFVILSNDEDFQSSIRFWKEKENIKMNKKAINIKEKQWLKDLEATLKKNVPTLQADLPKIIKIIDHLKKIDKQAIHQELVKACGKVEGVEIYRLMKPYL